MDARSFFVFSELWGALLLLCIWLAHHLPIANSLGLDLLVSLPFAICMFKAMWSRLKDLKWPIVLLAPVCTTYTWILCDHLVFDHRWPIEIPGALVAWFGIYTGILWLLISVIQKKGD